MQVSIVLSLSISGLNLAAAQTCPDLAPCTCNYNSPKYYVTCDRIPMEIIKDVFRNTPPIDIDELSISFQAPEESIPADLLGQSRVIDQIILRGPFQRTLLTVDPDAFNSSKITLKYLYLLGFDMSELDFSFLEGFSKFYLLSFNDVTNLNLCLPSLPFLPALTDLYFSTSSGLNETSLQLNDTILPGLKEFWAYNCNLDEEAIDKLLLWILPSSAQTLKKLNIANNQLVTIPRQLAVFQSLEYIDVSFNRVNLDIQNNAFFVPGRGGIRPNIVLHYSRVIHIESGAFQGNYSSSTLDLGGNFLTRFEESVFKPILQDMALDGGVVYVTAGASSTSSNYFDCYGDSCHLSWLLRDNRNLLDNVIGAQCPDGTSFNNLSPAMFENCP